MEGQQGQYSTENYANDFTPRVYIEYDNDPEDDEGKGEEFEQAVRDAYTQTGKKKKRFILKSRLPGDKESKIHEFAPNMDHEWHETMARVAESQIIKSHGFHPLLLGNQTPGKLGQTQEFAKVYKQVNFATIRPYRKLLLCGYHIGMRLIDEFLNPGKKVTSDMSLGFQDMFKEFLKSEIVEDRGNVNELQSDEGKALENLDA